MMSVMPKKKGPKGPTQISMRLKPAELGPLDADRKALPGVPVSRNTYAKHAVLSFPKLRKLVETIRRDFEQDPDRMRRSPRELLEGAGL